MNHYYLDPLRNCSPRERMMWGITFAAGNMWLLYSWAPSTAKWIIVVGGVYAVYDTVREYLNRPTPAQLKERERLRVEDYARRCIAHDKEVAQRKADKRRARFTRR